MFDISTPDLFIFPACSFQKERRVFNVVWFSFMFGLGCACYCCPIYTEHIRLRTKCTLAAAAIQRLRQRLNDDYPCRRMDREVTIVPRNTSPKWYRRSLEVMQRCIRRCRGLLGDVVPVIYSGHHGRLRLRRHRRYRAAR